MRYYLLFSLFLISVFSQAQKDPKYTLYLVGDAGKVTPGQTQTFNMLKQQMEVSGDNSGIIFLGDNIYQLGMPPKGHPDRAISEKYADSQIEVVKDYNGDIFFIPGNHDWAQGKSYGWSRLANQEAFIESQLDSANVFLPSDGCPGPVEVPINEELTIILIDFQWFLHPWDKPNDERGGCDATGTVEAILQVDDIIKRNKDKKIVVATHHPMYTYGSHGGSSNLKDHIFPLTALSHNLYIPLPGIGSIYPVFRKVFGNIQDVTHPKYKAIRNAFTDIFEKHPGLIHVAGHEHSLQYSYKDSVHYIVSGSGAKTTFVRKRGYAEYAESVNGFAKLLFYEDGTVNVEYWNPESGNENGEKGFEKRLFKRPYQPPVQEDLSNIDFSGQEAQTVASKQYKASPFRKKIVRCQL